jgi:Flp pilus assembly protein CpaB
MNNLIIAARRFFQNKNVVTILGVIGIVLILFFGYRYQIKKQVNPVKNIPVAAVEIQPRTKITADMIDYIDVAPIVLQSNVYTNAQDVIGKYSNYNTMIPVGSLFYKGTVVDESDLPNSSFVAVGEGLVPYNFAVNMETTYGNSILPDDYIDIYMKAVNENGQLMVGKLIENVKVLAVKDSSGRNVFENTDETRTPAYLIFGVTDEINILLRKASYMSSYSTVLFPVPHGGSVSTEDGETMVSSQTLKNFINANTVPNDEIQATTTDTTTTDTTTTNKES